MTKLLCVLFGLCLPGTAQGEVQFHVFPDDEVPPWGANPCMDYDISMDDPGEPWTVRDEIELRHAANRCPELYGATSCLIKFVRVEPGNYHAICRTSGRDI